MVIQMLLGCRSAVSDHFVHGVEVTVQLRSGFEVQSSKRYLVGRSDSAAFVYRPCFTMWTCVSATGAGWECEGGGDTGLSSSLRVIGALHPYTCSRCCSRCCHSFGEAVSINSRIPLDLLASRYKGNCMLQLTYHRLGIYTYLNDSDHLASLLSRSYHSSGSHLAYHLAMQGPY